MLRGRALYAHTGSAAAVAVVARRADIAATTQTAA